MDTINEALKMFKLDNGMYPDTKEGLKALVLNPNIGKYPNYSNTGYIDSIPKDPWKKDYLYIKIDSKYDLISFGADRKEGGDDEAKDVFFSKCKE